MADLKSLWQSAKTRHGSNEIIDREVVRAAIGKRSGGVMDKLKKRIRVKIWISVMSIITFLIIILLTNNMAVRILLSFVEVGVIAGLFFFYKEYRELKTSIDITQNPAEFMEKFVQRIKKILKYEEMVGLTLYPPSFAGGFVLGTSISNEGDPYFSKPIEWVIFIVLLILITPACHWLAKRMNNKAFGKLIRQLEDNIQELRLLS